MALTMMPWHVLGVRFLDRVGKGFRGAPRDALIADSTEAEDRGRAFGFHRAMDHAGAVIGPLIAFALLHTMFGFVETAISAQTYRKIFWVATLPALGAILVAIFLVKEIAPPSRPSDNDGVSESAPLSRPFKSFLGILALFTLGNSSDAFLLLRAQELGILPISAPILWILLHIVKSLSSTPGSAWSDRIGKRPTICIGWIIYALIYVGFAFATECWHVWLLFALYGIYFGLTEGSEKAFVADLVSAERRSTAYGIHGSVIGLAALPASVLFGLVWTHFGSATAFSLGATLSIVAALLLATLRPSTSNAQ